MVQYVLIIHHSHRKYLLFTFPVPIYPLFLRNSEELLRITSSRALGMHFPDARSMLQKARAPFPTAEVVKDSFWYIGPILLCSKTDRPLGL